MQRVFFPHDVGFSPDAPFLETVAAELVRIAASRALGGVLDMSPMICVLPGRRAIRTLEAFVTRRVSEGIKNGEFTPVWTPPLYLTVGETPEKLYEQTRPIANTLTCAYCERRALTRFLQDPDFFEYAAALFPCRNGEDQKTTLQSLAANPQTTLNLAQTFVTLAHKLANERLTHQDVARACQRKGLPTEEKRWLSIAVLDGLYREELERAGYVDRDAARENALKHNAISPATTANDAPCEYYVIGATDLGKQQKDVFAALGNAVNFWVYAPTPRGELSPFDVAFRDHPEDFFDEYGVLRPERWDPQRSGDAPPFSLPIPEENIFQVESPIEEGEAAALLIRELSVNPNSTSESDFYAPIPSETLTIGAPDPESVPFISNEAARLGYATIRGEGESAPHNRVYRTLELLAQYLETRSYDVFGELLRRPDVERWINSVWNQYPLPKVEGEEEEARQEAQESAEEDEAEDELLSEDALTSETPNVKAASFCAGALVEFNQYRAQILPSIVDPNRWFRYVDEDNSKRNRFYSKLRRAAHILDSALVDFYEDQGPRVTVDPTLRSGIDLMNADLAEGKIHEGEYFALVSEAEPVRLVANLKKAPLKNWTQPLANLVAKIYAPVPAHVSRDAQFQIQGFLNVFSHELDALYEVPEFGADDKVAGSLALRLILNELGKSTVPSTPQDDVVELQGWLDLLFDDAPYLILTGFTERIVPSSVSSDLFLPNGMCETLGLSDSTRVYARDAYLAYTLAASRDAFFVVFSDRSLQQDPKLPSRFIFATDPNAIPGRVVKYFGDEGHSNFERLRRRHSGRVFPRPGATVVSPESRKGFRAPTLRVNWDALLASQEGARRLSLNVTDFQKFLASPYVFFLDRIVGLQSPEVASNELNAANFGNLAHDVLRAFGKDEKIRSSANESAIYAWTSRKLDDLVAERFHEFSSPFVRVQVEELRRRLRAFSSWQARWRESGRVVQYVEKSARIVPADLGVKGPTPPGLNLVEIQGRIDRIDYDPRRNCWYVFDYKTFDVTDEGTREKKGKKKDEIIDPTEELLLNSRPGNTVDHKHVQPLRFGAKNPTRLFIEKYGLHDFEELHHETWVNLQLPLYRHFLRTISPSSEKEEVKLGYIVLNKSAKTKAYLAPWTADDLRFADVVCRWVVDSILDLCQRGEINPRAFLVEGMRECGRLLEPERLVYDDFAPITLSYLEEL